MLLLAFETSAKAASVALFDGSTLLGEQYQNTGLTHSQTLLVMAEELLRQCGKTPQEVEAVAVANGPGSFTGPGGSHGNESACNVGDLVQSLGWEDLKKRKATHSSILAWGILWTEEPGSL